MIGCARAAATWDLGEEERYWIRGELGGPCTLWLGLPDYNVCNRSGHPLRINRSRGWCSCPVRTSLFHLKQIRLNPGLSVTNCVLPCHIEPCIAKAI